MDFFALLAFRVGQHLERTSLAIAFIFGCKIKLRKSLTLLCKI